MSRRSPTTRGLAAAALWVLLVSTTLMGVGGIGDLIMNDGRSHVSVWNVLVFVGIGILCVGALLVGVVTIVLVHRRSR